MCHIAPTNFIHIYKLSRVLDIKFTPPSNIRPSSPHTSTGTCPLGSGNSQEGRRRVGVTVPRFFFQMHRSHKPLFSGSTEWQKKWGGPGVLYFLQLPSRWKDIAGEGTEHFPLTDGGWKVQVLFQGVSCCIACPICGTCQCNSRTVKPSML